jgi:gluconokinase
MTAQTAAARVVFMGVSGCGKSSLAAAVAEDLGLRLVEGDDFHPSASRDKMSRGIALTDADRVQWLQTLAQMLRDASGRGMVLTCTALERSYRDQLRAAAPGLRFVFVDIGLTEAQQRVASRSSHFFSPDLVKSQFDTLESPVGEEGVLRVDAVAPLQQLRREVARWLGAHRGA